MGFGLELVQLFALLEHVHGLAGAAGADGLGPLDDAVLADEHGGAGADAGLVEPEAVGLRDITLRVEVGEQGEADAVEAGGPCFVTELAIDADTQNLGITGLELAEQAVESRDFDASCRGEVERVEHEKNVLLTLEARKLDLRIKVAIQLEIGCLCACIDHIGCGVGDGLGAAVAAQPV